MAETGIGRYTERLAELNDLFRAELDKTAEKEIDFSVLEAAQIRGNLFVRRVVAAALGTHHEETEAAAALRGALVKPILDQCERVRQARKGRRQPGDVDPDTGDEVVPEPVTP